MPTGHVFDDPLNTVCHFTISGPTSLPYRNYVCEEKNSATFCFNGLATNPEYFRWRIINESGQFQSEEGMQGNTQSGGSCLTITQFPSFPYYPQFVTILFYSLAFGTGSKVYRTFEIRDCDGDDPTCKDYYNFGNIQNGLESTISKLSYDDASDIIVYDILGNLIYKGRVDNFENRRNGELLIYLSVDALGNVIRSEKRININ